MLFCKNCGCQLDSDARFCANCGIPVSTVVSSAPQSGKKDSGATNRETRKEEYEGTLRKCPNCGSLVKSFSLTCVSCGYEFRNASSTFKMEDFESKYQAAKSNAQRVALIQSLAVPNTKEDVLEMFYLASGSVAKSDKSGQKLDEAWQAKFEQSYWKAGVLLANDPERERVDKIYKEKKKDIEKWKKHLFWSNWGILIGCFAFVLFNLLMLFLMFIISVVFDL